MMCCVMWRALVFRKTRNELQLISVYYCCCFIFRCSMSDHLAISTNSSFANKTLQVTALKQTALSSLSIILIILSSIICVMGFLGNITIATIILKRKKMQTPTNWFVFNLAICDLAIVIITIPYNLINPFIDWPFGNIGCKYLVMPVYGTLRRCLRVDTHCNQFSSLFHPSIHLKMEDFLL